MVIELFSKMIYFILYNMINDATHVANLYFKEVVKLYGIPRSVVPGSDVKFLSHVWVTL